MKPLNPVQLNQLADQHYQRWYIEIDPAYTPVEDVFRPQFWASSTRLSVKDVIRVRAKDDSYDFQLRVVGKHMVDGKHTLRVEIWPKLPDFVVEASVAGSELIPTTLNGKPVPRIDYAEADGWRVIGFTGEVVARGLPTEGDAQLALSQLLDGAGIKRVADRAPVDAKTGQPAAPRLDPNALPKTVQKKLDKKEQMKAQRESDLQALAERAAARRAAEA